MDNRRIRRLPRQKNSGADAAGSSDDESVEIVDLASQYRREESRREIETSANEDRLERLRLARIRAGIGDTNDTMVAEEIDDDESIDAEEAVVAEETELFKGNRERRIFESPVQEQIADTNEARIRLFRWIGMVGGGLLVAMGCWYLVTYIVDEEEKPVVVADNEVVDQPPVTEGFSPTGAKQLAYKFINATSMSERLQFVRYPDKTAKLMVKDKRWNWDAPLPVGQAQEFPVAFVRGQFFTGIYVEDDKGTKHPIDIEVRSAGNLIDWEAFAEYNEVPWDVLMEEQSLHRDYPLRAVLSLSDYYNYQYTEDEFVAFRIANRHNTVSMFAYARRDTWIEKDLRIMIRDVVRKDGIQSSGKHFVQIRVRFDDQPTPEPMAEISSFEAPHWFSLPPEIDESDKLNPRAIIAGGTLEDAPHNVEVIDYEERRKQEEQEAWRKMLEKAAKSRQ